MILKLRHFYQFGPFRLEPDERLLANGNQALALAPKYFDLLVFLVQNSGRLLTKDQIMQTVWSGSFVEEANLTVAISAIRKTLGEKESGVQYIETVPKKGYRFTAEVREVDETPTSSFQSKLDPTISSREETPGQQENSRVEVNGREDALFSSVNGRPATPAFETLRIESATLPESAERLVVVPRLDNAPHANRYKRIAALMLITVAVLVAVTLRLRQPARAPLLIKPRSLAILPLQNLKHDADTDFLGFSLADAVINRLDYVRALSVRPSTAVEKYRNESIDIQNVGAALNVDTILTGSFLRDGEDLRITYQLIEVKTSAILGRGTIDLKYDKLLRVQDRVAQQIVQNLQLNLSASEAERIKAQARIDPLAYEYYLRGVDLHGQHSFPLAIKMLEKSTEIDPNYAAAWAYLGASYTSDAAFEFGGREQYQRAQAAYQRALAIQPSDLDAQIFLANLLVDTGRVEQAVPLLLAALNTNPNYAPAHWELGYAYRFAGMLDESVVECERARQLDPWVKANGSALNTYLYLGQYEKFLDSLPDPGNSSFLLFYRGFGEFYERHMDRASRDFERAYQLDPTLYALIGKALNEAIGHREANGLKILHTVEGKIKERGVGDPEATYKVAQAYAVLQDKVSALRTLHTSVESGFFCYPYLAADPLLNGLRNDPEFSRILEAARQRHQAFKSRFF
jgi:DNA-binding winged helix-turn-helix (wHTH) protein/TolB-like protein